MDQQPQPDPQPDLQSGAQTVQQLTGDVDVDRALSLLTDLDERPVDEHVAVLEQAHAAMRDALSRPAESA